MQLNGRQKETMTVKEYFNDRAEDYVELETVVRAPKISRKLSLGYPMSEIPTYATWHVSGDQWRQGK